jgi:hypothetical protein
MNAAPDTSIGLAMVLVAALTRLSATADSSL